MTTTGQRMRAWTGPAILSFGFRPFFLMAALWAALAMTIWVSMMAGHDVLPIAFDPIAWHSHELLFGYLGAVIAGFLLTAVPNWTGSLPIVGWPLAGLAGLWVAGRVAVGLSGALTPAAVAVADLAFPVAIAGFLGREIVAGRNWKNVPVLGLVIGWVIANAAFHWDSAFGGSAAQGIGLRAGLAVAVMLIALIGGRIVPSFTRNWLAQRGIDRLPTPFGRPDAAVLGLTLVTLALWVVWPDRAVSAAGCGLAGVAHMWRLARWQGQRTGGEALVWVLHAGYAFVPLGFLALAASWFTPGLAPAAQHVWMAGAIGLMTLAVMTRASLGHAGRPLHATPAIATLYVLLIVAVAARLAAGALPEQGWLLHLAAFAWIGAFGGFAVIYWPILVHPRKETRAPSR